MNSIVVHYKELALKGRNRPWFIKVLIRNLRTALAGIEIVSIRSVMGRIEITIGAGASWTEIRERVSRLFGIANFSRAGCAPLEFGPLASAILRDLGDRQPESFRVDPGQRVGRSCYLGPARNGGPLPASPERDSDLRPEPKIPQLSRAVGHEHDDLSTGDGVRQRTGADH